MVSPVCKWVGDIHDLTQAPEMLRKAFRIATTGRPGPIVLNIRGVGSIMSPEQQIDDEPYAETQYACYPAQRAEPNSKAIENAVSALQKAQRPCIVAGGGVNLSRAWNELKEVAEIGQFPVATTISGKGSFSERHPLSAGPTGPVIGVIEPVEFDPTFYVRVFRRR